jgi:hypothetical protein
MLLNLTVQSAILIKKLTVVEPFKKVPPFSRT